MHEKLYYLGIKAIIQNAKKQVLLLKHAKGYWDFPGGRVQQGSDVLTTFLREIEEETGVTNIENINPDAMVLTPIKLHTDNTNYYGLILWYHTCTLKQEKEIILSDEHTEYAWVSTTEVSAMNGVSDIVVPHIFSQ